MEDGDSFGLHSADGVEGRGFAYSVGGCEGIQQKVRGGQDNDPEVRGWE
jgi:hypothetical protein